MSGVELTEAFLAKIAGWEAMKKARSLLEQGAVLSSNWIPPLLKGVVQEGTLSYRAGLVIKDTINLENICRCRPSQEWGTICAHSVAVGLHHLRGTRETASPIRARPTQHGPEHRMDRASPSSHSLGRAMVRPGRFLCLLERRTLSGVRDSTAGSLRPGPHPPAKRAHRPAEYRRG
jgi:hypothetical protein